MKKRAVIRWMVRWVALAVAVLLALGGPAPAWGARVLPSLSPLAVLAGALAQQSWYAGFFWGMAPLAVLAGAVWRGRIFCRWICPAGTLYRVVPRVPYRLSPPRINAFLFWFVVSAALIGAPLWLALDPLSSAARFPSLFRAARPAAWIPGLLIPLFLVVSVVAPMAWCTRFCPLGYFFDLLGRRPAAWRRVPDRERRQMLLGILCGLPLASLARFQARRQEDYPVLPPGALRVSRFGAVCTRCFACVGVCPTGILRVGLPRGPLVGWFQPQLKATYGGCAEDCNACSLVCPSGAIRPVDLPAKQHLRIGTARVRREACLGWADDKYCLICEEVCPYHAIDVDTSASGVPRPVVAPDRCRGCCFCQHHCPAVRNGKAIIVHGVPAQENLPAADP